MGGVDEGRSVGVRKEGGEGEQEEVWRESDDFL